MSERPRVSVLMTVYNGERYLKEAVDSILDQTFTDFEFIIVDDGSTDGTAELLAAERDSRIRVWRSAENIGRPRALNVGLELADGAYLALLDSDDVALPHRLERQVSFLDEHRQIGILGSPCLQMDAIGRVLSVLEVPTTNLQIRWKSLLAMPFANPTVMMRPDVLARSGLKYDEGLQLAQDYDLLTRALNHTQGANLDEPLVLRRVHGGSISGKRRGLQQRNSDMIALRTIREQLPGFAITSQQVSRLRALFSGEGKLPPDLDAKRPVLAQLYLDLLEAFAELHPGEPELKALRHHQAMRAAHRVLRLPLRPGWLAVVRRVMTIPGLPRFALLHLPTLVCRRLPSLGRSSFGERSR